MSPDNKLIGMKDICKHLQVSESTALTWHREYQMPIKKLKGIWMSTRTALDKWFEKYIVGEV